MMPKSQQIILAICLILFIFNLITPILGEVFNISVIDFSSIILKITQGLFVIIFSIFTYRQIKRKGWK
ncbi:Uncharacterised protein [Staphylococcus caeli]|uniref:Uncharacterized protein n=1 Tax=Staphylococcus caeli TaxID=2201815 RepID=A0A1D4MVY4_9STAP|nr:Uncharacterised protein [Staphylococcus caeli]SCT24616.1 Uncharacterised protein [Staphylococcus caeli]